MVRTVEAAETGITGFRRRDGVAGVTGGVGGVQGSLAGYARLLAIKPETDPQEVSQRGRREIALASKSCS